MLTVCTARCRSVRLTPEKRLEIAERVDHEAKVNSDTVAEAGAFLGRWRRARHLLFRENLVNQLAATVELQMQQANCPLPLIQSVVTKLRASERREINIFASLVFLLPSIR